MKIKIGGLGLLFIILKLCNVINWNWIWVLLPFWWWLPMLLLIIIIAILKEIGE